MTLALALARDLIGDSFIDCTEFWIMEFVLSPNFFDNPASTWHRSHTMHLGYSQ